MQEVHEFTFKRITMQVELTKTKDVVKALLENHQHLRDSDERLICNIWINDLKRRSVNYKELSAEDFLQHFANGNLTNPESIRRVRQKLQEKHSDLRGNYYGMRNKNQSEIKKELRNFGE